MKMMGIGSRAPLQIEAAQPGHLDVQHQAIDGLGMLQAEELLGRAECPHGKAGPAEQSAQGSQDGCVVIDDTNERSHANAPSWSRVGTAGERRAGSHRG
jgi:hypothetical protein